MVELVATLALVAALDPLSRPRPDAVAWSNRHADPPLLPFSCESEDVPLALAAGNVVWTVCSVIVMSGLPPL